jgi:hypothetical protein
MSFDCTARLLSVSVEQPLLQACWRSTSARGILRVSSTSTRPRTDPAKLIETFGVPTDITVTIRIKFIILPSHRPSVVLSFAA